MTAQQHIDQIKDKTKALRSGFILGRLTADPKLVSVQELGQIDMDYIDEVRDESR